MRQIIELFFSLVIFNAVCITAQKLFRFLSPIIKKIFYRKILNKTAIEQSSPLFAELEKNSNAHRILYWNFWFILWWSLAFANTVRFSFGIFSGFILYLIGNREAIKNEIIRIKHRNVNQNKINEELETLERKFILLSKDD